MKKKGGGSLCPGGPLYPTFPYHTLPGRRQHIPVQQTEPKRHLISPSLLSAAANFLYVGIMGEKSV